MANTQNVSIETGKLVQVLADLQDALKNEGQKFQESQKNDVSSFDFSTLISGGEGDCTMKVSNFDFAIVVVGYYTNYASQLENDEQNNVTNPYHSQEFCTLMFDGFSNGFDKFKEETTYITDVDSYFKFRNGFIKFEGEIDYVENIFDIFFKMVGMNPAPKEDSTERDKFVNDFGEVVKGILLEYAKTTGSSSYGRRKRKRRSS